MVGEKISRSLCTQIMLIGLFGLELFPLQAHGQAGDAAPALRRNGSHELSAQSYKSHEVKPPRRMPVEEPLEIQRRPPRPGRKPPTRPMGGRTFLSDAHRDMDYYQGERCENCHDELVSGAHIVRRSISCRLCHGPDPIAPIDDYFSPMNPIRRHANVCARCHPAANPSFATYVIHEPSPGSLTAKVSFSTLYYAHWFMAALLIGTLAFFIPHSVLIALRELLGKRGRAKKDCTDVHKAI